MFLTPADLEPFATIDEAKATEMIADAEAMAALAAPCITEPEFVADAALFAAVKSILRGAVLRWNDAGSGAVTQQGAGPFQQTIDTRTPRRGMFWPSEITQLRDLCSRFSQVDNARAFSIRPSGSGQGVHLPWCDVMLGALTCSCGASLTNYEYPLYEGGALS